MEPPRRAGENAQKTGKKWARYRLKGVATQEAVVNLDCDTKYNGVNNCDVTLQDVHFTGLSKKEQETGMVCKGVKGTATVRPRILSSGNRA